MFQVKYKISFCYGHRLRNYSGKCRHLHGHNGIAEVELATSRLDGRGMVMDFGDIKKRVKKWIDDHFDHKMLLRRDDPFVKVLRKKKEPLYLFQENPTAENIAREIFRATRRMGLPVVRVVMWETEKSSASYSE